ncbi:hypothetical protein Skr01_36320 [Sphaerisporangium krabiense]|uniref:Uncharacterized protein n=1 Tax=Sphaerisporangium krabiense TaxID=763782 RepID=A0A7W8Z3M4_9ACTN|nr:hypothetical protein [Sphaerisporangium krabiense]MBB5626625.1 hypothetical protein [Sphaerisporangium krabiense]GII63547.1 hypothetical protein Skr01_36320 [Sphaerisporangium krabiense]
MGWTPIDSDTFAFADGNAGHVIDFGSAPAVGDIDILFANSDTVVATPTNFTCPSNASQVNNQGAYGFYRKAVGGEGSTVTIQTTGDFNCVVGWMRWRGGQAFDVAAGAQINSSVGAATPAIATGALAETGELVVAAALLHRLATPAPSSPLWSSGYTPATEVTIGSGSSGCTQFTAYKTNAGLAAESPSCTWTDGAFDRYAIALTFTAAPVAEEHSGTGSLSATATLTSSGVAGRSGTGNTSASASLTSSGVAGRAGTGAISATVALTSSGTAARRGSGTIAASAALTGSGTAGRSGAGLLAAAATFVSTGRKGAAGTGSITAEAFIRAGGPTGPGRLTTSVRDTSTLIVTLTP